MRIALVLLALLASSCGDDDGSPDAAATDAGGSDAGGTDAGDADGGGTDAGGADAGGADAGDTDAGGAEACTEFADGVRLGDVESDALDEISGLVVSGRDPAVLWVHNDGGVRRVYAMSTDGTHLADARFGVATTDVEDIALGLVDGVPHLYVADMGDNRAREGTGTPRDSIQILRFEEPTLGAGPTLEVAAVEVLPFVYPDRPHDAEALLHDPRTGDLYIVTKEPAPGPPLVFRAAAPHVADTMRVLEAVGEGPRVGQVTGGDVSRDGGTILLRTYSSVRRIPVAAGTLAEALTSGSPFTAPSVAEPQGEAVGFAADGRGYFTISERLFQPVWFFGCR